MRTLHLHIKGVTIRVRGRTIDATNDDPVLELIDRLQAVLKQQGYTTTDAWEEGQHPRADDGKFGSGTKSAAANALSKAATDKAGHLLAISAHATASLAHSREGNQEQAIAHRRQGEVHYQEVQKLKRAAQSKAVAKAKVSNAQHYTFTPTDTTAGLARLNTLKGDELETGDIFKHAADQSQNRDVAGKVPEGKAKPEELDLSKIIPAQDTVEKGGIARYLKNEGRADNVRMPLVVRERATGKLYLQDGHHRAAAAILAGLKTARFNVVTMDALVTHDDAEPDPDGHWVTINGAHVFVNGQGDIVKGPAHLVGGNVNEHKGATHHKITGGVKAKIHALMSSGVPFTFPELKTVLGNPPDKALTDAIAQLKNPKWAGPKGALEIVKGKDGKYTLAPKAEGVAKAPETPAEPDPFAGFTLPAADPAQVAKAPQLDPDPDPDALEWEPGMPEEAKAHATVAPPLHGEFLGTKPTTHEGPTDFVMPKEKADKVYKDKLDDVLKNTALAAKELPADQAEKIALAFKQGKSNAMAEWAANTYGTAHTAKQQEVFKADLKLVDNLAHGMNPDEALTKWKTDTALEKQGLLDKPPEALKPAAAAATQAPPSKVPPPPQPPPVKASGVPSTATTPHFSKVSEYVPADHVGITASDIGSGSIFSKQITSLKSKLQAGHPDPVQNKKGVQAALTERLKDSAAFQHIKSKFSGSSYGLEGHLISCWAGSSGGSNPTSNAAQLAIRDAFGMNKADVSYDALNVYKQHGGNEEKVWASCAQHMGLPYEHPDQKAALKAALHDFAIAQHQNTQDHFKQLGITHVYVARGMGTDPQGKASEVDLKLQPASSFSANWSTAKGFSGGKAMYYAKVPVSQVLSSYVTGYGCSNEHELVVLAHPKMTAVEQAVGSYNGMSGLTEAMEHLDQHLPGAGSKKSTPAALAPVKPEPPEAWSWTTWVEMAEAHHKKGDLPALKALQQQHKDANAESGPVMQEYLKGMVAHLEHTQAPPKSAAVSTKFKPAAPPAKPGSVKSTAAKLALKAAKKLDLPAVEAELESLKAKYPGTSMSASKQYIPKLIEQVKAQLAAKEAHEAAAKAAKAAKPKKMAMHGTTPVQAKPVDTTPAAPAEGTSFYPSVINTAQQLHKQGNANALKQYALGLATTANPDDPVHAYVAALTKHLESKAAPTTPAAPAPHKVVGYAPGVPSHHLNHPHYDPVAYANWQAQGKSEFQIGKTLAAIKFAAKKKAEAAAAKA